MSKKKKNKTLSPSMQELAGMGITDIDSFYSYVCPLLEEDDKLVATRELGYECDNEWMDDYLNPGRTAQDTAFLLDCGNNTFLLWKEYGGEWTEIAGLEDIEVFHNLQEAMDFLNEMEARPSLKEQILEVKKRINAEGLWIQPVYKMYNVVFRIYVDRNFVAENLPLQVDIIAQYVAQYRDFERACKDAGYSHVEIFKPSREWNSNQRYYSFIMENEKNETFVDVHIPSALQGRRRSAVDVLLSSKEPWVVSFRQQIRLQQGREIG